MVFSRLDYCNGLLDNVPNYLLGQLSGVMRAVIRLILVPPRTSYMTDVIFTRLQKLDVHARVVVKLCVLGLFTVSMGLHLPILQNI